MVLSAVSQAQTTISAARTAFASGTTTATVSGRVTNYSSLGPIRYFQDATGGIAAYFASGAPMPADSIRPGDSIRVTGTIVSYNNLLEFNPITNVTIIQRGGPSAVPAPVVFTAANGEAAFAEQYEGMLVRINGLTSITSSTGGVVSSFAGNTNYRLNGNAALPARVNTLSTDIVGRPTPSAGFDAIGIMSQFSSASATTGYQFLPRTYSDFVQGGAPNFTVFPYVSDLTTTTLTINFSTDNAGNAKYYYGTSATSFSDSVIDNAVNTTHTTTLAGLQAGTIYYVKVVSTNTVGTNATRVIPFVTVSNSTGNMKSYFVQTVNTSFAYPGNEARQLNQTSDDTLIAYINRAQSTLDIAIYNWNNASLSNISTAVNDAKARGVAVRIIADGSTAQNGLLALSSNIPTIQSPQTSEYTIMHNKFVIIDANSANPNLPIVWTGSTNWTADQMINDYNNIVIIQDQSLAKTYTLEFEEMWGSSTETPGNIFNGSTGTARFGVMKRDNTPHNLKIGGKKVEVYFSPSDGTNSKIIEAVNTADFQIQTANLIITKTDVATAIRNRVQRMPGSCSGAIVNDTSGTGAGLPFVYLKQALGNRAKINPIRANIFHHKYLIVDQSNATSDPLVLTGSHNWSTSGDTKNDENTLVIHDVNMANQFYQEFAARMIEFGMPAPCPVVVSVKKKTTFGSISVYPNPSNGVVRIEGSTLTDAPFLIVDLAGKEVMCGKVGTTNEIVTNSLVPGTYVLNVHTATGIQAARLVIQ